MISTADQVKENLSKWDELSPLTDIQLKSVLQLADLSQLEADEGDESARPESNQANPTTTPVSVVSRDHRLDENINELLYNFDLNDIEDPRIDRYVQSLQRNSKKCAQIGESIDTSFQQLNLLFENYEHVSQKTRSLHVACEQLLSDQVRYCSLLFLSGADFKFKFTFKNKLVNASYLLNSRLSYFTDLEMFMQVIKTPCL